ncbi:flavin-containing monooxygenase [Sulfitobacter sp. R86518]|uniref:flavin-containing monooxygenase n=1 Tax=Sulfitobacter sp. R86518 TaxID=3093858 RepID=UPI0036DF9A19
MIPSVTVSRTPQPLRIAVVGAGPAGLAMARALKQSGHDFSVFERNQDVGGIWDPDHVGSPMYDAAHFISSKGAENSTFEGHPFPESAAIYPSHKEVLDYLRTFAKDEGLLPNVTLGCGVSDAVQSSDGIWHVTTDDGKQSTFDALVCCSGTLWDPVVPNITGRFSGVARHAVSYRSSAEVCDKNVLVVGCGNSGADIASDMTKTAKSVTLSMRRGYWFVPKFIAGQPSDMVFSGKAKLPDWVAPPDPASLLTLLTGQPSTFGLPDPDHPPFASHPVMNSDIPIHVGHGRILPKPDVAKFDDQIVHFTDGSNTAYDEVVFATGYRVSAPFLRDAELTPESGNRPDLWMRVAHRNNPDLYALGMIETNSSVYRLFDKGAHLIVAMIEARADMTKSMQLSLPALPFDETDLAGENTKISSDRHFGYVDSRIYSKALDEALSAWKIWHAATICP